MKKRIGILCDSHYKNTAFLSRRYVDFAEYFGEAVLLRHSDYRQDLDILILPGGADVNPIRYKEIPHIMCGDPNPHLEYFDTYILPLYKKDKIPIFGICRGHQTFAVSEGFKLIQHIHHATYSTVSERRYPETVRGMPVNSLHHQVVAKPKKFEGEILVSDKYDTIEALQYANYPAITVQWHPELIFDDYSTDAVQTLIA